MPLHMKKRKMMFDLKKNRIFALHFLRLNCIIGI